MLHHTQCGSWRPLDGTELLRLLLLTTSVLSCGAAAAGREPALTMREIVENVRANELLYADLEVRLRMDFRLSEDLGMRLIKEN